LIYIAWDGLEILKHSYTNMAPLADGVIIVWSTLSNSCQNTGAFDPADYRGDTLVHHEPSPAKTKQENERDKRNAGLREAKRQGYTHFLMLDVDEIYDPQEFLMEKERFRDSNLEGLVCGVKTYFKSPTLTIGADPNTRVPFIHKISPSLHYAMNKRYPFAYDKNGPRIDPTRQLNIKRGVEWSDITMHHYSHVRIDIRVKIENSSANLGRSSLLEDWLNAKEGYRVKMYDRVLVSCENQFNIEL
jgi:hypothetical protein